MGLGSNHTGVVVAANFIPEIWSDETIAAYKQKLVLGNLVTKVSFKGKKGDTLHIPVPARGDPTAKAVNTAVTIIADTAGVVDILINKHFEYSKLYEDIAEMQALSSMRKFYTEDAGYSLARRVDKDLHLLGTLAQGGAQAVGTNYEAGVIGGDGSTAFSGTANTNTGNGTISAVTIGANCQVGAYRLICSAAATNSGTFQVFDPAGRRLADLTVATAYAGQIGLTVADGSADWIVGDDITVTVAAGNYDAYDAAGTDGTQIAAGILYAGAPISAATQSAVAVVRDAVVDSGLLTGLDATATAALEARGIIVR